MTFKANIKIRLRPSILDPQGKATHHALGNLGLGSVAKVRIGKYVEMWIEAEDLAAADAAVRKACEELLANPVMEDYSFSLERVEEAEV